MTKLFFSALFSIFSFVSVAQTATPEKVVAALDSFSFIRPQEKAYIQTDRNDYLAGESIWFKTYATLGEKPTILSKVIYAELVDLAGKVIEKKMLKLKDGTADGVIDLRTDITAGTYYLRCYTMWMLNTPDFIMQKKIRVLSNTKNENSQPATNVALKVSFFPEGGSLVAGLKNIVAFKVLDAQGNPVTATGEIINAKNEKLVAIKTMHDGMGSFELQPNAGETYKAMIQTGVGSQQSFVLPVAKEEGIVLSVDNSGPTKIFVKAARSEKSKEKYNSLLVIAQLNYQVAYMGKFNFEEGLDAAAINKKALPPGIMQITVLTEDGRPLAERLVFISNHTLGNPFLQTSVQNTDKRKKNVLMLDATAFNGLQASVAVTNAASESYQYTPTIQSALLLSSDLKGYINNPGYYFKDKEPGTIQNLDLLMMVHGWRRYNLEEIMANKFPPLHYPFETGLSITGKVLQSNGKSILKDGKINMVINGEDSTKIMTEAKTNESSVFVVSDIDFTKAATVYYQGTNVSRSEAIVSVKIDSAYFDTLSRSMVLPTPSGDIAVSSLLEQLFAGRQSDTAKIKTIREVVLRAKKRSVEDSLNLLYASDIFFFSDQTLTLNPNINYYDIWQFLRMNVPGIMINRTDTGTQVNFSRYDGLDFFSENAGPGSSVAFFLNEVPVDISLIESLDPSDVGLVKIFKGNTGIALGATRGAIAVYTSKGKTGRDWRKKGFDFFKRSGYSANREFYHMDYSKVKPESVSSDVRTTLYWNPEIKIINGKASIEFYNDDVTKKIKVVVEGIDKNGKLLHAEKEIE